MLIRGLRHVLYVHLCVLSPIKKENLIIHNEINQALATLAALGRLVMSKTVARSVDLYRK